MCGLQGLQFQALTNERNAQEALPVPSAAQLKHVLGVHSLGMGFSSKAQQAQLLCTGDTVCHHHR